MPLIDPYGDLMSKFPGRHSVFSQHTNRLMCQPPDQPQHEHAHCDNENRSAELSMDPELELHNPNTSESCADFGFELPETIVPPAITTTSNFGSVVGAYGVVNSSLESDITRMSVTDIEKTTIEPYEDTNFLDMFEEFVKTPSSQGSPALVRRDSYFPLPEDEATSQPPCSIKISLKSPTIQELSESLSVKNSRTELSDPDCVSKKLETESLEASAHNGLRQYQEIIFAFSEIKR
jgi:hypothetical protein